MLFRSISAEFLLVKILQRAKYLTSIGESLFASPSLDLFLKREICEESEFRDDKDLLEEFSSLDDNDIFTSIKVWMKHDDRILSFLSKAMINRRLFRMEISNQKISDNRISQIKDQTIRQLNFNEDEADYIISSDIFINNAYSADEGKINILFNDGKLLDIVEASELLDDKLLSKDIVRYFVSYPKELILD